MFYVFLYAKDIIYKFLVSICQQLQVFINVLRTKLRSQYYNRIIYVANNYVQNSYIRHLHKGSPISLSDSTL